MASRKLGNFFSMFSLGLVFICLLGWFYLRTEDFFPTNTQAWKEYIQTSIIFLSLFFAFDSIVSRKTEEPLFRVGFLKEFWVFLLSAIISAGCFYVLGYAITGGAIASISTAMSSISWGTILLYALCVSYPEELIFRGRIANELRYRKFGKIGVYLTQALIFAVYHWGLGRSVWSLLIYIPLGIIFMAVKDRFSPVTNMANAGVHFSWDLFILGFFASI